MRLFRHESVVRGPAVMGLFGKSGLQGPPTQVVLLLRDNRLCGCPSGATGFLLFTIWDPVTGPGRTNAWKQFGLKPHLGIGRLGSEGFWVRNYGGGGSGCRPPFWRTPVEPHKGLGPVTLQTPETYTCKWHTPHTVTVTVTSLLPGPCKIKSPYF
jgi:hypothetical protein